MKPHEDPAAGATSVAYTEEHRMLAARVIEDLRVRDKTALDAVLVATGMLEILSTMASSYPEAIDNALATIAQLPGAPGGLGAMHAPGRVALAVLAEVDRLYTERIEEAVS